MERIEYFESKKSFKIDLIGIGIYFDSNNRIEKIWHREERRIIDGSPITYYFSREQLLEHEEFFKQFMKELAYSPEKFKELGKILKENDSVFYEKMKEVSKELQDMFKIEDCYSHNWEKLK